MQLQVRKLICKLLDISIDYFPAGGHYGALQALLHHLSSQNYSVCADESHNRSPLHIAAWRGHKAAVKSLATLNSDINITDQNGRTPLDLASSMKKSWAQDPGWDTISIIILRLSGQGHVDCVATLLDFGAQPDFAQPGSLLTPLHRAGQFTITLLPTLCLA